MPKPQEENTENKGIRLNRYIANSGICTRREADKLIAKGLVEVNGKVITEMGYRVQAGEKVSYLGEMQNAQAKKYILINKPKACSFSHKSARNKRTVYDIISYACYEELSPADTLDLNTTGVVLMTNDKELIKKINKQKKEVYHVFLDKEMQNEDLEKIKNGLKLKAGYAKAEAAHFANSTNKKEIGLEIIQGQKDTVAQMMDQLGYKIERLDRVLYAGLSKKNVPRGKWRFLDKKEVQFLHMSKTH